MSRMIPISWLSFRPVCRALKDCALDAQPLGQTSAERQPERHKGQPRRLQLDRADDADHRQRVHHEHDRRNDETEFNESHF